MARTRTNPFGVPLEEWRQMTKEEKAEIMAAMGGTSSEPLSLTSGRRKPSRRTGRAKGRKTKTSRKRSDISDPETWHEPQGQLSRKQGTRIGQAMGGYPGYLPPKLTKDLIEQNKKAKAAGKQLITHQKVLFKTLGITKLQASEIINLFDIYGVPKVGLGNKKTNKVAKAIVMYVVKDQPLPKSMQATFGKKNPRYDIPGQWPASDYMYAPAPKLANWTSYPQYSYDQFYRPNTPRTAVENPKVPMPKCPTCGAGRGKSCVTRRGAPAAKTHKARHARAQELMEKRDRRRISDYGRERAQYLQEGRLEKIAYAFAVEDHRRMMRQGKRSDFKSFWQENKAKYMRKARSGARPGFAVENPGADCPTCGAYAGEQCLTNSGKPTRPHKKRARRNGVGRIKQSYPKGLRDYYSFFRHDKDDWGRSAGWGAQVPAGKYIVSIRGGAGPASYTDIYSEPREVMPSPLDYTEYEVAVIDPSGLLVEVATLGGGQPMTQDPVLRRYAQFFTEGSAAANVPANVVAQLLADLGASAKKNPRTKRGRKKQAKRFTVYHADHGIKPAQMRHIQKYLDANAPQGFFIKQVNIPKKLGPVPNALYGPDAGDKAVSERKVHYMDRSGRGWKDRMVDLPVRPWHYVQVIGVRDGNKFTLFTVYGGPLAPQNPADPNNPDPAGAKKWWSKHALSSQQWAHSNPMGPETVEIPVSTWPAKKVDWPMAQNAGPYTPDIFPYGQGGRPYTYALSNPISLDELKAKAVKAYEERIRAEEAYKDSFVTWPNMTQPGWSHEEPGPDTPRLKKAYEKAVSEERKALDRYWAARAG